MLTAKQLPSGNWNVKVYSHTEPSGKRIYKSFTDTTERKVLMIAYAWQEHHKEVNRDSSTMTLSEAIDSYISLNKGVLSPSTISGYIRIKNNHLIGLMPLTLAKITQERVQKEISSEAERFSPKTVSNTHGLLSTVMKQYRPEFILNTKLPQKRKYISNIPTPEQIGIIINAVKGQEMELPVLLAVWLGLRVSEIRAIAKDKINGNKLLIDSAIVQGESGAVEKGTKTYEGTRVLEIPPYIQEVIKRYNSDYLISFTGCSIYKRFTRLCKGLGLPHFRFHDLRHTNASIMLRLNVPDKYAKERGGWGSDIYKKVYQHTMQDMNKTVDDSINAYFTDIIQHEMQHNNLKDK